LKDEEQQLLRDLLTMAIAKIDQADLAYRTARNAHARLEALAQGQRGPNEPENLQETNTLRLRAARADMQIKNYLADEARRERQDLDVKIAYARHELPL
jgi:hypothetical protein